MIHKSTNPDGSGGKMGINSPFPWITWVKMWINHRKRVKINSLQEEDMRRL
jgi:hypothetical protein